MNNSAVIELFPLQWHLKGSFTFTLFPDFFAFLVSLSFSSPSLYFHPFLSSICFTASSEEENLIKPIEKLSCKERVNDKLEDPKGN